MFFDKYYNDKGFYNFCPKDGKNAHTEALDFITARPKEAWRGYLGELCSELLRARAELWGNVLRDPDKEKKYIANTENSRRLTVESFLLDLTRDAFVHFGIRLPDDFFEFRPEAGFLKRFCVALYAPPSSEGETPIIKETGTTLQEKTTDEDFAKLTKWNPRKKLPRLDRVCVFLIKEGIIPDGTTGEYLLKCVLHAHYKSLFATSKRAKFICFIAYVGKEYFNRDYEKAACEDMEIPFTRLRKRKIPDFESELSQLV